MNELIKLIYAAVRERRITVDEGCVAICGCGDRIPPWSDIDGVCPATFCVECGADAGVSQPHSSTCSFVRN